MRILGRRAFVWSRLRRLRAERGVGLRARGGRIALLGRESGRSTGAGVGINPGSER